MTSFLFLNYMLWHTNNDNSPIFQCPSLIAHLLFKIGIKNAYILINNA